jgi:glycosyltransferase involved in cell wall biosynthesis
VRVALVSEGTYPYAMGGVSVWCDQLIRGLSEVRWEMVALTVDGTERPLFDSPPNLDRVSTIPLWTAGSDGRRAARPGRAFQAAYEAFLAALMTPLDTRPDQANVNRSRFLLALHGLYEYAADGGDLGSALLSNPALTTLMDAWHDFRADLPAFGPDAPNQPAGEGGLTLANAADAAWLTAHMLRPLTVDPVRADIVHASMNGLCTLVGMAAKWRYGTPMVISEHGIYLRERYISFLHEDAPHAVKVLILSFFRSLAGAAYLFADALAPHSSYNRRWQLHNGADPELMWTMYNGVTPEEFPAAQAEPAEPTIAFMGRIDPLKDLHTLIRAFALVRERIPAARLRIFGGTPAINEVYRTSCVRLIEELGLTGAAVLEGMVSSPVDAYHGGSLVALTSISEGFPYTVVEAMACGRPMVCTNVGGVAEAVGEAGIVVSPRDFAGVAEACVKLLSDDDLRHRLGALARARVLENFTLQRSLDAYRAVYKGLLVPQSDPARPAPPRGERSPGDEAGPEERDKARPGPRGDAGPPAGRPQRRLSRARGRATVGGRRWPGR